MVEFRQNTDTQTPNACHAAPRRLPVRIKPSTAIRQDYTGLAELCHSIDEPVVLTRNGEADLVVMSYESFRRREAREALQAKLLVADRELADGTPLQDAEEAFARVRERIDAAAKE
jgi:PHD/YefM family antitoxin component YafN of YafNO toxin-antitoxin module